MSWFYFSLFSVFALAAAELTQQRLLNNKNPFSPRASAVLTFLLQGVLAVLIVLFSPLKLEIFQIFQANLLIKIVLVTLIASIGMVFYLKSFQVKNISLSTIFVSLSVVVSTTLGVIIFQESTSPVKFVGILLILVAIVSLNYKNSVLEKNHLYGLLAGTLFGVAYTFDKSIVGSINPVVYIALSFCLVALFGFCLTQKM